MKTLFCQNISQNTDTVPYIQWVIRSPSQIKVLSAYLCLFWFMSTSSYQSVSSVSILLSVWGEIDVSAGGSAIEVMIACHCQCCLPETVREISHRIQAVPALEIVLALLLWCNIFEKRSKVFIFTCTFSVILRKNNFNQPTLTYCKRDFHFYGLEGYRNWNI